MRRLLAIAGKELRLVGRDPPFLFVQIVMPPLLLVLFGSVFSITLRRLPVAVEDRDRTPASRDLLRQLEASAYVDAEAPARPRAALEDGASLAVVEVPAGYGRDLARGRPPGLQILIDGSDGAAPAAVGDLTRFADEALPSAPRPAPAALSAVWFNPEQRDAAFFVPGVLALIVLGGASIFTSLSLVREKSSGTWTMLGAAPIGEVELLAGKLLPYLCHSAFIAVACFAIARFVFDVPFRGPPAPLVAGTLLFIITGIGLGGVFAALSQTEQVAWRWVQIFVLLPCLVLSGFVYPLSGMPRAVQALSHAFPIRPYLELLRGVLLKGAGAAEVAGQLRALAGFAAGSLLLGVFMTARSRRPAR